jgi:hypothetical protein
MNSYYYLVARPLGYSEITYATAAADTYIRLKTPDLSQDPVPELDVADVERPNTTTITIGNTKTNNNYAIVDPETGAIIALQNGDDGTTLTFNDLDPNKTYQVRTKYKDSDIWLLKGVRVYPHPDMFSIDYVNELVKSAANGNGSIPTNVEYRIQGNDDAGTWIIGGADDWEYGNDSYPVDLGTRILNNHSRSILDSLETIDAGATLTYRILLGFDRYEGASVIPELTLPIPKRPASPVRPVYYKFDFETEPEEIDVKSSLQFAQAGTTKWIDYSVGDSWTFTDAGWGAGSVERTFHVRFPAVADEKFASSPNYMDTIPARPPAPEVDATSDGSEITILGLDANKLYQYKKTDETGATVTGWTDVAANSTQIVEDYLLNHQYHIRLKATDEAPASFATVISMHIGIQPITFLSYPYGSVPVTEKVVIINPSPMDVTDAVVTLAGDNVESFTLNEIVTGGITVDANSKNNTNWNLTPVEGLDAGEYTALLKMTYTYQGNQYDIIPAPVYLRVSKIEWDMSKISGSIDLSKTTTNQLVLNVSDAPEGATLKYYFGTESVPPEQITIVGEVVTFTGLNPTTAYDIRVVAEEDKNHLESALTPLVMGYTAYEKPDFHTVIDINYYTEELYCKDGYSESDYTVISGSMGVWSLTNLLDTLTTPTFQLSLVRNAGVNPPYPASEPGWSNFINGRPAAPNVNVDPASGATISDGKIELPGAFQYRAHGSSEWLPANGEVTGLGVGQYDVRLPANDTHFASKYVIVTISAQGLIGSNQTICNGDIPQALTLTPYEDCTDYSYQWEQNSGGGWGNAVDGTGANAITYQPPELTITTQYRLKITQCSRNETTNTVTITVYPVPRVNLSVNPAITQKVCHGSTINDVFLSTDITELTITYSWDAGENFAAAGLTSKTGNGNIVNGSSFIDFGQAINNGTEPITVTVIVTPGIENCDTGQAESFSIIVYPELTATIDGSGQTICYKTIPETLTVTAGGGTGSGYTYQWQESATETGDYDAVTTGSDWSDGKSDSYTLAELIADKYYRCVVTDAKCGEKVSDTVKVIVRSQSLYEYPDLRIRICPDAGTTINLSKYIDMLDLTSILWEAPHITIDNPTTSGTIQADKLRNSSSYTLTYTVGNPCLSDVVTRKVYLKPLKDDEPVHLRDKITICSKYAEALNINQLFGIEAGGTPVAGISSDYIETTLYGGTVFNGKQYYKDFNPSGVGNVSVTFTYTPTQGSCQSKKTYETEIILTQ